MKHSHLRGLKLLFCATLALAIILSLLPAQGAKAWMQGQTCPDCGTGILIPISYNTAQHALSCSKTGCIHAASNGYIWENHHGGNACTDRPICEVCGQEYSNPDPEAHNWDTNWSYDETNHYHSCLNNGCTAKKDEAAHNYVWTYVDDATHKGVCACSAETTEAHYDRWASSCGHQPHCEKCDHDYGSIPEHEMWYEDRGESGHKPSCYHCDTYFFLEPHVGTSTCTEAGTCSLCGGTIPALGHDWATTLTNGGDTHYYACSRCDAKKDEAAHTYNWTYVDDSTHKGTCACGAEITEAHYDRWASSCGRQPHCEKCDHDYGTIPEHEMWYEDRGESGHKPSCYHCDTYFFLEPHVGTSTCTEAGTCSLCGGTIPALGHDWATTLTNGGDTHYYACSRCDAKKDEAAHTYNWTYVDDSTHKGTCACGAETTEVHYDRWADKCGRQPHCEKCDTDYGTPPEHEMWYEDRGESGHKPSCYHCDTYFFLEPHVGTSTCTEAGTCSLCGGTIPALGHDWATTLTNGGDTHYYACSRCDAKKDEAAHIYENWTKVDDSNHKGKCACGKEKTEPHSGGTATCQAKAKCEKCGEEYGDTLGHDLKKTDKVEPTCTTPGTEAYWTCQRDNCGKLFSDDQGENEINAPVTIKALGHDLIHHDAQAPTCTAIGWDAYQTCSRCDYTTYAEKPALGHSEVTGTAIAPTCTDNGLTEGMYCFRCGQVLIAQEDIPALGHDFAVTHRTITRVYFQCSRCRDSYWIDNAKSRNLLSSLVWNDRDENVEYTAGVAKANGIKVLTITPDAEAVEDSAWVSLRLKPDDVEQWKGEGIGTVAFQCGEVRMEISLSALTLDWFDLNEPFDYYVFTLAPEEDGTLVTVEAEIGTEKVAADEYDGITLVRGDTILEIVQNGIY